MQIPCVVVAIAKSNNSVVHCHPSSWGLSQCRPPVVIAPNPRRPRLCAILRQYYDEGQMLPSSSLEEARRFVDAKYMRLRHLTAELRAKDLDLARTLEDKMRIVGDMLVVAGGRDAIASAAATEDRLVMLKL